MAIRMRRGNEADFDPSKMLPGEWAVSTDTKYVRMCFSPGIVLRMATYEAFESDMAEMRKILSECQSIQTAVELIQKNVTNSELVIENYVKEAKQYRDEAEQFRNEAFLTTTEGYEDLVKNVSDNTVKIDTIIEKAELNIKNTVKGSNIHLTDSAESNVVALEMYGKTEQNTYTGKNLLDCSKLVKTTKNNVTFTPVYENGMLQYINVNGTASTGTSYGLGDFKLEGEFIASDLGGSYLKKSDGTWIKTISENESISIPAGSGYFLQALIFIQANKVCNNLKYYPMISLEGGEYEPYVGGMPSPNPSYPQEIKSVVINTIKTHGKNLVENCIYNATSVDYDAIIGEVNTNLKKGRTYTASVDLTVQASTKVYWSTDAEVISNVSYQNVSNGTNRYSITFVAEKDSVNNKIWLKKANNGDNVLITPSNFMIEESPIMTEYQPYQTSEITLSEPIELNGFNDVYDLLTSDGVTRRFAGKRILSSDIADIRITSNGNYVYTHELSDVKIYGSCLCTHFVGIGYDDRELNPNSQRCYIDSETKIIYFRDNLENLVFTDLENAKTFFDENEVYLVYELATPTTEELKTDFTALKTFYPETYVSNDADCDMSITYTADAKNYIDNKIALLTTAIYNNI